MQGNPKITVVVPVYNVKPYLNKCLQSLVNQTYQNLSVVLVDDGSTDGCSVVCDEWAGKYDNISVIHQKNQGVSAARNAGLAIVDSEYVGFADSDDWLEPQMYENLMAACIDNDADIAICRHQYVNLDGKILSIDGCPDHRVLTHVEATKEIMKDEEFTSFAWNKLYHSSLFHDIKYPVGRKFEDTAMTYKVFYAAKRIVTIPFVGYNYLSNPNGTCQSAVQGEKYCNNFVDNIKAFTERYMFARTHADLADMIPLCALKAYGMLQGFLHAASKKYELTDKQWSELFEDLKVLRYKDLTLLPASKKLDYLIFRVSKNLLKFYLRIVGLKRANL